MKTPQRLGEEVAGGLAERMDKGLSLARQFAGVRDDVNAIVTAERQRADELAEALREIAADGAAMEDCSCGYCRITLKVRAALAAYDAEAK